MKRELFNCDYCTIEKFNSETQEFINLPFSCATLAHWKQHITRPKHNINIARNNNLEANLVVECKSCNGIFTNSQYIQHKNRNIILRWTKDPIYNDCSCNNFIYGGKRFENLNVLKDYAENRYDSGRKKNEYIPKPKTIKSFADRAEPLRSKMKEKEAKQPKKKETKTIGTIEDEEFIQKELQMDIVEHVQAEQPEEDEYEDETPMEKKKRERNDMDNPPIFDDDDMCSNCGLYQNFIVEYEEEKLKRYNIKICSCDDSDCTDSD